MRGEDIYENGIVTATGQGSATVAVLRNDHCEECTAKIICGVGEKNENHVDAVDPIGVRVGDEVRIRIRGESLFAAAALLYGIPLLLILAGILTGTYLYDPGLMRQELWAFTLGIGLAAVYYLLIFLGSDSLRRKSLMPDIVAVRESGAQRA
jgi:positive regulator of sigma E activity